MRLQELLFEKEIRGKAVKPGEYATLYHLTNYQGFSVSISKNALNAFRQDYISTTWDVNMNSVGGRMHYHFKFMLDGKKCLSEFPGFHHKSYAEYADGSGHHDWNEREIALETRSIAPLSEYLTGLAIIVPIFSRSFMQWMFYEIQEWFSWTGNKVTDSAPKGIESLRVLFKDWGIPLYVQGRDEIRSLNQKEKLFINDCFKLIRKGMTFDKALALMVQKYPEDIKDHSDYRITPTMLNLERIVPKYIRRINNAIAEKDIYRMNTNKVRTIARDMFEEFGYSEDDVNRLMKACEEHNMFHPIAEPSNWSSIIRHMVQNQSINATIDIIGWIGENKIAPAINHWWNDGKRPRFGTRRHYKAHVS